MNTRKNLLGLAAAVLMAAGALAAQASPYDAGLSLVKPLDTLKAVNHASGFGGAVIEVGYNGLVFKTAQPYRLSLSVIDLPGKEAGYVKSSLLGFQGAADIFSPTGLDKLVLVAGLSLNGWRWNYQDATQHLDTTMKGTKFGARFGFDYHYSPKVTCSLLLQLVELGEDPKATQAYNPSWLQAGVKYRF